MAATMPIIAMGLKPSLFGDEKAVGAAGMSVAVGVADIIAVADSDVDLGGRGVRIMSNDYLSPCSAERNGRMLERLKSRKD